jgi:hypothetical protein
VTLEAQPRSLDRIHRADGGEHRIRIEKRQTGHSARGYDLD